MQWDGDVVLYDANGARRWAAGTAGRGNVTVAVVGDQARPRDGAWAANRPERQGGGSLRWVGSPAGPLSVANADKPSPSGLPLGP